MDLKTFLRANWDRATGCALVGFGAVALVMGWIGVSGTGLAAEQNPYLISGGLGGVALMALGCTVWLSADLQDEWRRLDDLDRRLAAMANDPLPPEPVAPPTRSDDAPSEAADARANGGGVRPAPLSARRPGRVSVRP